MIALRRGASEVAHEDFMEGMFIYVVYNIARLGF